MSHNPTPTVCKWNSVPSALGGYGLSLLNTFRQRLKLDFFGTPSGGAVVTVIIIIDHSRSMV